MSIDVTWPTKKSESEAMAIDCLKDHFSGEGIRRIVAMSGSDRKKIFNFIRLAGHHVNPKLLN